MVRPTVYNVVKNTVHGFTLSSPSWTPQIPTGLTAIVDSNTAITLNWTNLDTKGDGVRVYYKADGGSYSVGATLALGVATKQMTGLTANTKYYFYVVSYKGAKESESSNIVNKTTPTLLIRGSDIVDISGDSVPTNTGFGPEYSIIIKNGVGKIRQSGVITQVICFQTGVPSVSSFCVLRKNISTTYDLVYMEDITVSVNNGSLSTINLTRTCKVLEGDYVAFSGMGVGYSAKISNSSRFEAYAPLNKMSIDVDAMSGSTSCPMIKTKGKSPWGITVGDSIIGGYPLNASGIEESLLNNNLSSVSYQLSLLDPYYVFQNMGIGGYTITDISNIIHTLLTTAKPKIAIINGGVNDISIGTLSKADFLTKWTDILNDCVTHSIVAVICSIAPWTSGSNAQMQKIDEWNSDLEALVGTYTGFIFIDLGGLGKFRAGGDAGNLWDIITEYDADGVHFTISGYGAMASIIYGKIKEKYLPCIDGLPSNVTAKVLSDTEVELNWIRGGGVFDAQELYVSIDGGNNYSLYNTLTNTEEILIINNLIEETEYYFKIRGVKGNSFTDFTTPVSCTTYLLAGECISDCNFTGTGSKWTVDTGWEIGSGALNKGTTNSALLGQSNANNLIPLKALSTYLIRFYVTKVMINVNIVNYAETSIYLSPGVYMKGWNVQELTMPSDLNGGGIGFQLLTRESLTGEVLTGFSVREIL